jgi:hypothetical protein
MEVAVMIVIRSPVVSRRDYAYADTVGSRIETDLCCSRQSRADRNCRHKRNSKLSHVLPLCWLHYLNNGNREASFRLFRFGTFAILMQRFRQLGEAGMIHIVNCTAINRPTNVVF